MGAGGIHGRSGARLITRGPAGLFPNVEDAVAEVADFSQAGKWVNAFLVGVAGKEAGAIVHDGDGMEVLARIVRDV